MKSSSSIAWLGFFSCQYSDKPLRALTGFKRERFQYACVLGNNWFAVIIYACSCYQNNESLYLVAMLDPDTPSFLSPLCRHWVHFIFGNVKASLNRKIARWIWVVYRNRGIHVEFEWSQILQPRTQSPQAFWSADERLERLLDNGIKSMFFIWSPA